MEGKTGRAKGKENTCRTVSITKALADSGHSTARKGLFYFFAWKFRYSIETKNPNAFPIRKVFGLFVCGRSDRNRTCGLLVPNQAHYQSVPHPGFLPCYCTTFSPGCQAFFENSPAFFKSFVRGKISLKKGKNFAFSVDRTALFCYSYQKAILPKKGYASWKNCITKTKFP